jgi:fibro-slime domain-containing protein
MGPGGCKTGPEAEDPTPAAPTCGPELGFAPLEFQRGADGFAFDELLPDLSFETLRGSFRLSEAWDGCSVFTLVPYADELEGTELDGLFETAPNNRYIFYSMSNSALPQMQELSDEIDDRLRHQPDAVRADFEDRIDFVAEPGNQVRFLQFLDTVATDHFFIDSKQRLRDAGALNIFNQQGFVPALEMAQYFASWGNYERRLEDELERDAESGEVLIVPWIETGWAADTVDGVKTLSLPSADAMRRYDRVEIVVKEDCGERFPIHFGECPAWDTGAHVSLCLNGDCAVSERWGRAMIWRYITAYHGGGWWKSDVSHALPHFKAGGALDLHLSRNNFLGQISFHFYDDEVDDAPIVRSSSYLAYLGKASFTEVHNELFDDFVFTPPPGTTRVVMHAQVSGHGNQSHNGCAEFCTHEHEIDVNGSSYRSPFEMRPDWDCAARVGQGVVAGQFGTWFFDRGAWCPGFPVEVWREDITAAVDLDGVNTLRWTGSFEGDWPTGGSINSHPWLVFYGTGDADPTVERVPRTPCAAAPLVTVRDFSRTHPDFAPLVAEIAALTEDDPEYDTARASVTGVVAPDLVQDANGAWKPRFVWPENTLPFTTAANFDQWFQDLPGVNQRTDVAIDVHQSREGTAIYPYISDMLSHNFIDATFGFGDEGFTGPVAGTSVRVPANLSYTYELATSFTYTGGERLRVANRDDLWVFIDRRLVHENAGPWSAPNRRVLELDGLGLVAGQSYDLHVFGAFRRDRQPQLILELPVCNP